MATNNNISDKTTATSHVFTDTLPPIQLPPPIVHHFYIPQQAPPPPVPVTKTIKENARRSSHSAVEKRRRERMNDKIERLKTLIPSCNSPFPTSVQQPIHKLSVLQAAIDYIGELHQHLEQTLPKDNPLLDNIYYAKK